MQKKTRYKSKGEFAQPVSSRHVDHHFPSPSSPRPPPNKHLLGNSHDLDSGGRTICIKAVVGGRERVLREVSQTAPRDLHN